MEDEYENDFEEDDFEEVEPSTFDQEMSFWLS